LGDAEELVGGDQREADTEERRSPGNSLRTSAGRLVSPSLRCQSPPAGPPSRKIRATAPAASRRRSRLRERTEERRFEHARQRRYKLPEQACRRRDDEARPRARHAPGAASSGGASAEHSAIVW
jgi:hypothetical protein